MCVCVCVCVCVNAVACPKKHVDRFKTKNVFKIDIVALIFMQFK